jgi:ACT domain-containing protein
MSQNTGLTNRQLLTISHILDSSSVEEGCKKARISRATYYKWLRDENFKAALKRQRDDMVRYALDRLKGAITKAVEELIKLTEAKREEVRRLACNDIITHGLKSIEIEEIEQRLDKVERIVLERRSYK